jgi:hypothetical protein
VALGLNWCYELIVRQKQLIIGKTRAGFLRASRWCEKPVGRLGDTSGFIGTDRDRGDLFPAVEVCGDPRHPHLGGERLPGPGPPARSRFDAGTVQSAASASLPVTLAYAYNGGEMDTPKSYDDI